MILSLFNKSPSSASSATELIKPKLSERKLDHQNHICFKRFLKKDIKNRSLKD